LPVILAPWKFWAGEGMMVVCKSKIRSIDKETQDQSTSRSGKMLDFRGTNVCWDISGRCVGDRNC
jgi:hypothetical protein